MSILPAVITPYAKVLCFLLLFAITEAAEDETETPRKASPLPNSFQYWISGNALDARPSKTRGSLLLAGGGGQVMDAWKWFIESAGRGDIVVLCASGDDALQSLLFDKNAGVDSVETIRFENASAANDPRVLEIISNAEGIFLAGGKQTRYIDWWKGTPIETAINRHVKEGKPLGGSSAGLAIIGKYYYMSMNGSVRSEEALRDPFDKRIDIGKDFINAPLLEHVLTDSHFSNRKRLGRLFAFLGRTIIDDNPTKLVGLGIDEGTALCIEEDGSGRVLTEKEGQAWLVQPTQKPTTLEPLKPLDFRRVKVTGIGIHSRLNLRNFEVQDPTIVEFISAGDGELKTDP